MLEDDDLERFGVGLFCLLSVQHNNTIRISVFFLCLSVHLESKKWCINKAVSIWNTAEVFLLSFVSYTKSLTTIKQGR